MASSRPEIMSHAAFRSGYRRSGSIAGSTTEGWMFNPWKSVQKLLPSAEPATARTWSWSLSRLDAVSNHGLM